jgi:hypothetical protein
MADDFATWSDDYWSNAAPEPRESVGLSDYAKSVAAGGVQLLADQAASSVALQESVGGSAMNTVSEKARRFLNTAADRINDSRTKEAQEIQGAKLLPGEGERSAYDNFGNFVGLNAAASAPSMVVAGGIGTLMSMVTLSPEMAPYFASLAAGSMDAGSVTNEIYKSIDNLSDEQLKEVPAYKAYRDVMEEGDARSAFRRDLVGMKPLISGAVSSITSKFGIEGAISKKLAGVSTKGAYKNAVSTGLAEFVGEGVTEGTNAYLTNTAKEDGGLGQFSWKDVWNQALTGGVLGLATGTAAGAVTGNAPPPPAANVGNDVTPPVGSETQYPKAAAVKAAGKQRSGVAIVNGPVGETEAAALTPEVAPEVAQKVVGLEDTTEVTAPPAAPPSPSVPPEIADKARGVTEEAPATTPETPDQITAQFADLVSSENPRAVVFIPTGNKTAIPAEVSSNPNFETMRIGKGYPADTRGQYVYDKTKTDPAAIRNAVKTGTLGEMLGMGPTNKEQAVADIAAGAQPLAIQVRDENGTPKVEQGTSSATVAQDVPVVQANANPTDTIEVTTPEAVQEQRLEAAPALEPTKPNVGPKAARVLEAIGNKEVQEATNLKLEENVKAAKVAEKKAEKQAEKVATGPANDELVGKYAGKDAKRAESRAKRDSIAKSVFEEAAPTEAEANWNSKDAAQRKAARQAIVERVQRALVKAQQLFTEAQKEDPNFKMPTKMSPQMVNELVWLLEAQRFLSAVGRKDGGRTASYQEFVGKETSYRSADQGKAARAERRQGGDEAKRVDQGDVQEKADTIPSDVREASSPEAKLIAEEEDVPLQESRTGDELYQEGRERTRARSDEEVEASAQLGKAEKALEDAKADRTTTPEKRQELEKVVKDASDRYIASKKEKKYVAGEETGETDARGNPKFTQKAAAAVNKRPKFDAGRPAVAGKVTLGSRKAVAPKASPEPKPEPPELNANKTEYGDPQADEANKVQSAIEGKTVVQVAKWLENNAPRSSHRMVAKRVRIVLEKMQAAGVKFSFTVLHNGDTTPRNSGGGWRGVNILKYDQGRLQNDVYIVGADVTGLVGTSYEVVLHELIHAATKSVTFMGTRKLSADLKIAKLSQELMDVSNAIVAHFNKRAKMGDLTPFEQAIFKRMNNALANQDEILTWALSNEQMQEYLDGIEYKNTKQSLLKRIFTVIGEFFGIPATQGSALEEVLRVGEKIFDADETLPDVLEAHSRFTSLNKIEPSLESFFNPAIDANISSYIPELKDRQASVQGWAGRTWTKFRAFNQLEQDFRGTVFGPALTKINEARQAAGPRARNLKDRGDALASRLIDFERKNKTEAAEITSLAQEARLLGVSLEGKNDLGTDDSAHWQAKKLLPGLQARFNNNLSGEAKQIYRDMVSFYSDSHNMIVKASVKGILQQLLLKNKLTEAEIAGLTDRVINKKMNDTDKVLLGKTMFDNLKNAAEFHKVEGDYFPLMRFGDHVVRTEDTVKDTMGGTLEGNAVLFRNKSETAARKAAQAFAEKTGLVQLGRAEKTYFDRATGKEVTADEAKSLNDVDYGFRVRVQTQGVYFFESEKEAHAFVRTNPEGHDVVRAPEQRMGSGYQAHILSGTQLGVMEKSVDGRKDLSDGQKALIKSIIAQSSARMVSGNRIASRRLKSQKVTGASTDTARVLLQYNTAMSRHVSTAEAAPEIRDGLDKLNKLLETYEGNDRPAIVSMIEEVKARIDQGIHEPNEASQLMKDVLTTSSIARLFSPMYTALQMVQPWMSTLPMLGGRFGNMRAASALSQAYSDLGLGEAAVSGFLNTARATKQFSRAGLLNTDNIVENMRARFASDAGVTAMLDKAIELGSIDVNAGLEVSSAVADGRGRIGLIIAGTDRIARQLPQMAEAINRVSTGVAAYRLAREGGMSQDKATQFAIDTINNTQGDYSASNAPRFFNNPVLRPAMQFRKYAQMMTYLLVDLAKRTMNSDLSVEERKIAGKQLLNFVIVQIAMAGALSLPGLELVKAGFLIASVFGLGGGWDDQEEKLRKLVDQTFGRPLGQMITNGVFTRLGGYGIDVSQRMSLSDMWLFGEPRKNDSESQQAYLFRLMAGSSGSFLLGVADGVKDIGNGEIEKGLGKVLPVKFAADTAKAVGAYNKDRTGEIGLGTVAVNAFGVKTAAQAEKSRDIADAMRRKDERESKRKALSKAFYEARTPGERAKAVAKNREWNAQLSKSEWRLRLPTNAGAL